jgi:hypothetical protein
MSTPSCQYYAGSQGRAAEGNAKCEVLQPYDGALFAEVPGEAKKRRLRLKPYRQPFRRGHGARRRSARNCFLIGAPLPERSSRPKGDLPVRLKQDDCFLK